MNSVSEKSFEKALDKIRLFPVSTPNYWRLCKNAYLFMGTRTNKYGAKEHGGMRH